MLGTMGAPEKVDVNGEMVWICCDGCKDKLLADPQKYLAKIND
jgi:Cu(I)/Ag(I) efflux system membrane fusion protein